MHQVQRVPRRAVVRRAVTLGPANQVTLVRAVLTGAVAVLAASPPFRDATTPVRTVMVGLAGVALALDLVDGHVARRTGTVSGFGARFDMETDAALILVLSTLLVGPFGWWVLLSGLARYLLLAAQWLWPWLDGPVPPRRWRKVVAGVQGVVLLVGVAGLLPHPVARVLLLAALLLLALSFATEVVERVRRTTDLSAGAGRRAAVVSCAAVLLVWVSLDLPSRTADLSPTVLLRVPVEGLVLVALALVLPERVGRVLALLIGVVVVALAVVRTLDVGFALVLDRPFSPLSDWGYLPSGVGVMTDSVGRAAAIGLVVLAGLAVLAFAVLVPLAAVRTTRVARRHRTPAAAALVVLGVVPLLLGLSSTSTTAAAVEVVGQVRYELHDRVVFARRIAQDPYADAPPAQLLAGLRGHDVLVVFVESYGRVAVQGTSFSPSIDRVLDRGTGQLRRAGYRARSAWLTSPTFGAGSWLAHASIQSGLWVNSQGRYDQLLRTQRLTLTSAFGRAGWRTVLDAPADTRAWPEGRAFYRPDAVYDSRNVGYAGPAFGYAPIPDQYTLSWLAGHELRPGPRPRVMAEVDLVSSHHPWAPLPHLVPWGRVGDGSVFDPMPARGDTAAEVFADPERVRAAYAESVRYSLRTMIGFLRRMQHRDPGLVVLMLGDHQPHSYVTGSRPGHQVPVSLVTRDRSVVRRTAGWHWQPGLHPGAGAPVWGMHSVRDRIFSAFDR